MRRVFYALFICFISICFLCASGCEKVEGVQGIQGEKGDTGTGVKSAYINDELHLILILTDGSEIDSGFIGGVIFPEEETYVVIFKDYNDTVLKTDIVTKNGSATAPENPERENYNFIGWDKEFDDIIENTVVTAKYEEKGDFVVTFYDFDGTTVIGTSNVKEGGTATLPNNPTKEGCTFIGWEGKYINIKENCSLRAIYSDEQNIFKVSSVQGKKGDTVIVLVEVCGNVKFNGFDLIIYYDNELLTLSSFDADLDLDLVTNETSINNGIIVNYSSASEKTKQRDIIELTFTINTEKVTNSEVVILMTSAKELSNNSIVDSKYIIINGVIKMN